METKKIAIGSDHAGYHLKSLLINHLRNLGYEVQDFGTNSDESVDYPDFAHAVAKSVENGDNPLGVLICGSANGVAITANKHAGIRCGIAWNVETAKLTREHNDANILALPARFIGSELAARCLDAFLQSSFEGGRHQRRVDKIAAC